MKTILLGLFILLLTVPAFADETISVTITDEEYKVLEWQLVNPQQWVDDAVKNKIRKSEERMLIELTDQRLETLTAQEKETLIANSILQTRAQRDAEEITALEAKSD